MCVVTVKTFIVYIGTSSKIVISSKPMDFLVSIKCKNYRVVTFWRFFD